MSDTPIPAAEAVLVLSTGGTIDKQYFDATSQYQISDSFVPRLLEWRASCTLSNAGNCCKRTAST